MAVYSEYIIYFMDCAARQYKAKKKFLSLDFQGWSSMYNSGFV
jgi:hypothetical protein